MKRRRCSGRGHCIVTAVRALYPSPFPQSPCSSQLQHTASPSILRMHTHTRTHIQHAALTAHGEEGRDRERERGRERKSERERERERGRGEGRERRVCANAENPCCRRLTQNAHSNTCRRTHSKQLATVSHHTRTIAGVKLSGKGMGWG